MPKVIQVIESQITRGNGKTFVDPIRTVTQFHSFDGELLGEFDPVNAERNEAFLDIGNYVENYITLVGAPRDVAKCVKSVMQRTWDAEKAVPIEPERPEICQ